MSADQSAVGGDVAGTFRVALAAKDALVTHLEEELLASRQQVSSE